MLEYKTFYFSKNIKTSQTSDSLSVSIDSSSNMDDNCVLCPIEQKTLELNNTACQL